ncbi:GNAT family N-acetyltransferase [Gottfriedia acidiceleris]|uniref:GNAT family N-acetyltransferase n=1 Tax=Gottfriedia acidiceleris TaxID=371036 RepID=UPI00101D413E|nr:GNAT family protein [Gottfriedia acidiceleris]
MENGLSESKRIGLLPISLEHSKDLFIVYSDDLTTQHVPRKKHTKLIETEELVLRYLNLVQEQKGLVYTILNIEEQTIIGNAGIYGLDLKNKRAFLGAVIHSRYWGKGFVTETLTRLLEICFSELGLVRVEGSCAEDNIASEKVMQKIGMTYEGTLRSNVIINGKSRNSKIYSILDNEFLFN